MADSEHIGSSLKAAPDLSGISSAMLELEFGDGLPPVGMRVEDWKNGDTTAADLLEEGCTYPLNSSTLARLRKFGVYF